MPRRASGAARSGNIFDGLCGVSSSVPMKSTLMGVPGGAAPGGRGVRCGGGGFDCATSERQPSTSTLTAAIDDHANLGRPFNLIGTPFKATNITPPLIRFYWVLQGSAGFHTFDKVRPHEPGRTL